MDGVRWGEMGLCTRHRLLATLVGGVRFTSIALDT